MTRKKAIEIVVETAKCSWVPKDWEYAAASEPGAINQAAIKDRTEARATGFWINPPKGDPTYRKGCAASDYGDKGWYFSRTWLEKNGHL